MKTATNTLIPRSHQPDIVDDFWISASIDVAPIAPNVNNLDSYWLIVGEHRFLVHIEQEIDAKTKQTFKGIYGLAVNPSRAQIPICFFDSEQAEDEEDYVAVTHVTSSNTPDDEPRVFDPLSQYIAAFEEMWAEAQKTYRAYENRIEELREFASEDDEPLDINESSEEDFWCFVKSVPWSKEAELMLMENGNLRAVWKRDDEMHIGLHFLGNSRGTYVIFKRRHGANKVSRAAGIDTLEGVKKQARAFDISLLEKR